MERFDGQLFCPECWSYRPTQDAVSVTAGCPCCKERRVEWLVWLDDESVRCETCGKRYVPGEGSIDRN